MYDYNDVEFEDEGSEFQFRLDVSDNKFSCHKCFQKSFNKFIGKNDVYLGPKYGVCTNTRCGYQNFPKSLSKEWAIEKFDRGSVNLDKSLLQSSMNNCLETNLAKYLMKYISQDAVLGLLNKYNVGKSTYGNQNHDVFWRLNSDSELINGKIIKFNQYDGKVSGNYKPNWFYAFLHGIDSFQYCFFGEHLMKQYPNKTIAIVEDEITAIICDYFWPEYVWIATGKIDDVDWKDEYFLSVLKSRKVLLYPDSTIPYTQGDISFLVWNNLIAKIKFFFLCDIRISSLLKSNICLLSNLNKSLLMELLCYNEGVDTIDRPFGLPF